MILSVNNLSKSYDGRDILKSVSFHIEANDKLGITGINGAGKTTLLRQIVGEESPDSGSVTLSSGVRIGYLSQTTLDNSKLSIYDEVLSAKKYLVDMEEELRSLEQQMNLAQLGNAVRSGAGSADSKLSGEEGSPDGYKLDFDKPVSNIDLASGSAAAVGSSGSKLSDSGTDDDAALSGIYSRYAALSQRFELENGYAVRSNVTGILKGLGFKEEEFDKPAALLSGGQKTRLALGRLLIDAPELLILDEPTNHLDISSVNWLESYLKAWRGAIIIVSHDRYFLDHTVNKILDIENGTARMYLGNYTLFAEKKAALRKDLMKAYLNNQAMLKHQQEVIDKLKKFNREKSIKRAESREKALARMERIDKPFDEDDAMKLHFTPSKVSGKDVLYADGLSKSFGSNVLFRGVNLDVKRGEKLAIIGPNGTGKTTLLKIIMGQESADSGEIEFGSLVEPAYYDQEHHVLDPDNTVFDEISDAYPYMNNTQIRNLLAAFLFTGDEVFKQIKELSGGEQGRVSLAKLMLSKANLLLLDEPTNHLDITSKEILEEALRNYEGTVICVSHDRYFINRIATRILELDGQHFVNYQGNYDYYLEKKADPSFDKMKAVSGADTRGAIVGGAANKGGSANGVAISGAAAESRGNAVNASANSTADAATNMNDASGGETLLDKTDKSNGNTSVTGTFASNGNVKLSYQEQKERRQQLQKLRNRLSDCEKNISEHEDKITDIDSQIALPENATNSAKLNELSQTQAKLREELEELYESWAELSELLDEMEA